MDREIQDVSVSTDLTPIQLGDQLDKEAVLLRGCRRGWLNGHLVKNTAWHDLKQGSSVYMHDHYPDDNRRQELIRTELPDTVAFANMFRGEIGPFVRYGDTGTPLDPKRYSPFRAREPVRYEGQRWRLCVEVDRSEEGHCNVVLYTESGRRADPGELDDGILNLAKTQLSEACWIAADCDYRG